MKAPRLMPYVVLSLVLHGALLVLLWLADNTFRAETKTKQLGLVETPAEKAKLPEVVMVDAKKVEALKQKIAARKRAEEEQRKKLARELETLKKRKEQERQRLLQAKKRREAEEARRKQAELQRKKKEEEARKAAALAKEKQEALEKEKARLQALKEKQRKEEERRRQEERAKQLEDELTKQLLAEQQSMAARQRQEQVANETQKYTALIRQRIYAAWTAGDDAVVKVKVAPGGLVTDIQCLEGSETACQDARRAVSKAEPLPVSQDPEVFQKLKELIIRLKREPTAGESL